MLIKEARRDSVELEHSQVANENGPHEARTGRDQQLGGTASPRPSVRPRPSAAGISNILHWPPSSLSITFPSLPTDAVLFCFTEKEGICKHGT